MSTSDKPPGAPALIHLDRLPAEVAARVVEVPAPYRSELAGEGLRMGRTVRVTGRAPFGGPVLLMVGRARLALSRSVAAGILVEPEAGPGAVPGQSGPAPAEDVLARDAPAGGVVPRGPDR